MLNRTIFSAMVLSLVLVAPVWAEQDGLVVNPADPATYDASSMVLAEQQGVIEDLSFAGMSAVISGYKYPVSANVKVEIDGSYGAFTMLSKGMKVRFSYLEFDDGTNLITEIVEDPAAEEF